MNPIPPTLIHLGPFQVRWYGVLIMAGVAIGAYFSSMLARKRGLNPDHVWNALIIAVVMAILGARLYHVFSTPAGCPPNATFPCGWPYYRHHFLEAFAIWKTGGFQGLGIYGAIVGGALGVVVYALFARLNPLVWLDIGAPGLAFGQFVGRWGNFINQELYGPPTGSDWYGLRINPDLPHQALPPGTDYATRFHPTFLYESIWSLGVFVILYSIEFFGYVQPKSESRVSTFLHNLLYDRLRDGDIFLGYIILYPLGRFWVEFFRPDAWTIGTLATAQWIALGAMAGSLLILALRHIFWDRSQPEERGLRATEDDAQGVQKATTE
jgi:phosphatidylglycerol:prolipoprotein diacylglycerol transferase